MRRTLLWIATLAVLLLPILWLPILRLPILRLALLLRGVAWAALILWDRIK